MSGEPRYKGPLTPHGWDTAVVCLDCGNVVIDQAAHARFHSILSSHAWTLAVLKTAHIAAHTHDKYDVVERIDSRKFDNWSADALAEVVKEADALAEAVRKLASRAAPGPVKPPPEADA